MNRNIVLLTLCLLLFACNKGDLNTHPVTSGEYLYCKVDGVDWYASKDDMFAQAATGELHGDTILDVAGYQGLESIGILVYANKITTGVNYTLSTNGKGSNAGYDNDLSTKEFETDSLHLGTVTITRLDRTKKLVEGTFSFTAYHPVKQKVVKVTDGFFSIYFQPH